MGWLHDELDVGKTTGLLHGLGLGGLNVMTLEVQGPGVAGFKAFSAQGESKSGFGKSHVFDGSETGILELHGGCSTNAGALQAFFSL